MAKSTLSLISYVFECVCKIARDRKHQSLDFYLKKVKDGIDIWLLRSDIVKYHNNTRLCLVQMNICALTLNELSKKRPISLDTLQPKLKFRLVKRFWVYFNVFNPKYQSTKYLKHGSPSLVYLKWCTLRIFFTAKGGFIATCSPIPIIEIGIVYFYS